MTKQSPAFIDLTDDNDDDGGAEAPVSPPQPDLLNNDLHRTTLLQQWDPRKQPAHATNSRNGVVRKRESSNSREPPLTGSLITPTVGAHSLSPFSGFLPRHGPPKTSVRKSEDRQRRVSTDSESRKTSSTNGGSQSVFKVQTPVKPTPTNASHLPPPSRGTFKTQIPKQALPSDHEPSLGIPLAEVAENDVLGEEWDDVADVPVAPGQMEPYTLAPDTNRCLIKGCERYGVESNDMRDHMERYHGWPSQDDIDLLKYRERYSLPKGTKTCPHTDCKWHHIVREHTWQVTEHMKLQHGWPRHKDFQPADSQSDDDDEGPSHAEDNEIPTMQIHKAQPSPSSPVPSRKPAEDLLETFRGPQRPAKSPVQDQTPPTSLKRTLEGQLKSTIEPMERLHLSPKLADGSTLSASFTKPLEEAMTSTTETSKLTERAPTQGQSDKLSPDQQTLPELSALVEAMKQATKDSGSGAAFTQQEDDLLIYLKEEISMPWPMIASYFPKRKTWYSLQSRYSNRLKDRHSRTRSRSHQTDQENFATSDAARTMPERTRLHRSAKLDPAESGTLTSRRGGDSISLLDDEQMDAFGDLQDDQEATDISTEGEDMPVRRVPGRLNPAQTPTALAWPDAPFTERPKETYDFGSVSLRASIQEQRKRNIAAVGSRTESLNRTPFKTESATKTQKALARSDGSHLKRRSVHIQKPYLQQSERVWLAESFEEGLWDADVVLQQSWDSVLLHADFTESEKRVVEKRAGEVLAGSDTRTSSLTSLMWTASGQQIRQIASQTVKRSDEFINRAASSIEAFLMDVRSNQNVALAGTQRLALHSSAQSVDFMLRRRQTGHPGVAFASIYDSLGPSRKFTGTSSDVNQVRWAPNGNVFAVGSAALMDVNSVQYNRRNNLLIGDITTSKLCELADHAKERESPVAQDRLLYATISAIEFSPDSRIMFTAGWDNTIRLWDVQDHITGPATAQGFSDINCRWKAPCKAHINVLSVSTSGVIAAGIQTHTEPIKLFKYETDENGHLTGCKKAGKLFSHHGTDDYQITPSCLRWGHSYSSKYLLAGFSERNDLQRRGETCMWDVEAGQKIGTAFNRRDVFDLTWSPTYYGRFAIGCTAGSNVNRGTKSTVRIHDQMTLPANSRLATTTHPLVELECPAWDMNDVVINPKDEYLVSAGCTDGTTYIWDLRWPDRLLHRLSHREPISELDVDRPREQADTGVRFLSWGQGGRKLFTGSSDGAVTLWDPYRSPEDAFQKDVLKLDSGIMAGAFSPDFSNLLIGDVKGSVVMLNVGSEDKSLHDCELFDYQATSETYRSHVFVKLFDVEDQDSVRKSIKTQTAHEGASQAVASGSIDIKPLGDFPIRQAVQGSNYQGPYDNSPDAPVLREEAAKFQAQARKTEQPQTAGRAQPRSSNFVDDEITDNEAWKARIPNELYKVRGANDESEKHLGCFRCSDGRLSKLSPEASRRVGGDVHVSCNRCQRVWRAGALGYELIDTGPRTTARKSHDHVPSTVRLLSGTERESEYLEHHHDLWELDSLIQARLRIG